MFKIYVHTSAPDRMKRMDFWCNFLRGTHWRKRADNAEVLIEQARYAGWGRIECLVKRFNNKYGTLGEKVRNFPITNDDIGDYLDIEELTGHGFMLVPDAILNDYYSPRDSYYRGMTNIGWGDYGLKQPDDASLLTGLTASGRDNEPIAYFSHGIPHERAVSLRGLVLAGVSRDGADYCYDVVYT